MVTLIRRAGVLLAVAVFTSSCAVLGFETPCEGTEVIARFEDVGDLVENANVQSSDVVVGRVDKIKRNGWLAGVEMCLGPEKQISGDVRAVVRSTSLLGEKFVDLKVQSQGPPFLEDGDIIGPERTAKAAELEEVLAELSTVLGTGNLEQLNRFTSAQAEILRNNAGDLREVLRRLRRFTDVLSGRRVEIARAIDSLDSVARTIMADSSVLERFLESFAGSSGVLAEQRRGLERLVVALDRFTKVSVRLLDETTGDLDRQFRNLRPVLRTLAANSRDLAATLKTLATFMEWFPETMPGDYLQLDVCQAPPHEYGPGEACPQSDENDEPGVARERPTKDPRASTALELIMRRALRETD